MIQVPIGLAIAIAGSLGIVAGWERMARASHDSETKPLPQRVTWERFSRGMLVGVLGFYVAAAGVATCFWDAGL